MAGRVIAAESRRIEPRRHASVEKERIPAAEAVAEKTGKLVRVRALRGDFSSVGTITLTIEVPLIFDSRNSHPLCAHEVFFNAQSAAQFLMSALPPKADIERLSRNVR